MCACGLWKSKCSPNVICTKQVREHFLPPLLDAILGDYYRNVPQAREPEVLSTVTAIVDKLEVRLERGKVVCVCVYFTVLLFTYITVTSH